MATLLEADEPMLEDSAAFWAARRLRAARGVQALEELRMLIGFDGPTGDALDDAVRLLNVELRLCEQVHEMVSSRLAVVAGGGDGGAA